MKTLNKKIAALLLSLCFGLCAMEAAAGGAGKPVEEPDDSFFAKIKRDAKCQSKFLVTENFTEVMDRLRESEARMIANHFDTIEDAWRCGENYIETLFTMGRQRSARFAEPEEQLQILECLLKAIYFTPIGGIGKSGDHWKEKREAMLLKYKPNNTGARCDLEINEDYIQKLVFLSMHGNYSTMRVTGPLNSN